KIRGRSVVTTDEMTRDRSHSTIGVRRVEDLLTPGVEVRVHLPVLVRACRKGPLDVLHQHHPARGVDQSRRSISGNVPGTLCERGAAQTLDLAPAVVVEIGPELLGLTSVHGHAQPVLAAQGDSGR